MLFVKTPKIIKIFEGKLESLIIVDLDEGNPLYRVLSVVRFYRLKERSITPGNGDKKVPTVFCLRYDTVPVSSIVVYVIPSLHI